MPIKMLFTLFLMVFAGTVFAENCTVTKKTCLQGPETRIINGVRIYRDCWQYETTTECAGGGTINYCAPLETNSSCELTDSECLKADKPGECLLRKKTFTCSKKLTNPGQGITVLDPIINIKDQFEVGKNCPSATNPVCSQTQMICTAPEETRVIDGVEVTLPCWEREYTFNCVVREPNESCSLLNNAGCRYAGTEKSVETRYYDCKESITVPQHEDIHFVESHEVLDRVVEVSNSCQGTTCSEAQSTCLANHPIFTDGCLKEEKTLTCSGGNNQTCEALENLGCTVKEESPSQPLYSCDKPLASPPSHIQWVGSEEVITGMTEDSDCPFASKKAKATTCEAETSVCVEGPETRIVDGKPVYKDCWRYEIQYGCITDDTHNGCVALEANPKCELVEKKCMAQSDAGCTFWTSTFECEKTPDKTITEEVCTESICQHGLCTPTDDAPNTNLADSVTKLEVVRQAAVYGDYQNLRFFSGEMNTCRNKLGGVSCCKGKVRGTKSNAAGLPVSYIFAAKVAKETIHTLGSPYVNDILMSHDSIANVMTKLYGEAAGQAYSPNLSYYGLSVSYVGGSVQFSFDPWTFFAMVALEVASDYLSCTPEEQTLQLKRGADTCRYVGSQCTEYFMGQCLIKTESYCCYNSKLALLVQEAAHEQMGTGWDVTDNQVCQGLTAWEMSRVDLGKIDPKALEGLIDTSKVNIPDSKNVETRAQARKAEIESSQKPYAPMPDKDGTCYGTDC